MTLRNPLRDPVKQDVAAVEHKNPVNVEAISPCHYAPWTYNGATRSQSADYLAAGNHDVQMNAATLRREDEAQTNG